MNRGYLLTCAGLQLFTHHIVQNDSAYVLYECERVCVCVCVCVWQQTNNNKNREQQSSELLSIWLDFEEIQAQTSVRKGFMFNKMTALLLIQPDTNTHTLSLSLWCVVVVSLWQDSHHRGRSLCDWQVLVQSPRQIRHCHGHLGRGELWWVVDKWQMITGQNRENYWDRALVFS